MDTSLGEPRVVRDVSKSTDRTRQAIILAYWAVVILALPLWWSTTSIERLSLPAARVLALADKELRIPVHVRLNTSNAIIIREIEQKLSQPSLSRSTGIEVDVHGEESHADLSMVYDVVNTLGKPTVRRKSFSFPFDQDSHSISSLSELISSLLSLSAPVPHRVQHVAQYAARYRLSFSLLNEDSAAGVIVDNWDISRAVFRYLSPLLGSLSVLHNFTIESQVQFHAPLAFSPTPLPGGGYGLSAEDLTVFINSAEWSLSSSISNDPVLHFVLFIPSVTRSSLHILSADGTVSLSTAFLVPQWGGVVIYNLPPGTSSPLQLSLAHLDPIFAAFSSHLLSLLGIPRIPPSVNVDLTDSEMTALTDWQLDTLLRQRILENVRNSQDTLSSIIKLVGQIQNMPIKQDVKDDINGALDALDNVFATAATSLPLALLESSRALMLASRAFFNPGMLAMLYFPAEHKYAVYTPLFASALIPLVGAVVREISAWRRSRKQQHSSDRGPDTGNLKIPIKSD